MSLGASAIMQAFVHLPGRYPSPHDALSEAPYSMEIRSRLRSRNSVFILGLFITAAFAALAVRVVNWQEITSAIAAVRIFPWVPLATASYVVANIVRGLRLRLLGFGDDATPFGSLTGLGLLDDPGSV